MLRRSRYASRGTDAAMVSSSQFKRRNFTKKELRSVEWMSKLGATQKELAEFFGVDLSTLEGWVRKYPEFKAAVKAGGVVADMKVVQSLFKRAIGFEYIEEEFSAIEVNGQPVPMEKMRRVKRIKKRLPPDVKAQVHWLKVRRKDLWNTSSEMIHKHSGNVNHLHQKIQDIPVEELSDHAKTLLFEIGQKQLSVMNFGEEDN